MSLIKSISGIRGTIGGAVGQNLTPVDIVTSCAGYGAWVQKRQNGRVIVIGRDARVSGQMVHEIAIQTLIGMGLDIIDLDLSTTPTVEMAVAMESAAGGIIITASHNPVQWNALKFLNHLGEFISAQDGAEILEIIASEEYLFAEVQDLGTRQKKDGYIAKHIESILKLGLVEEELIRSKRFRVAVDCINSTGSISIAPLLDALGCRYELIHSDLSGQFAHNPEPVPEHLTDLSTLMKSGEFDLGIAVDPDVDRLVFVNEDGSMFGEEYTIVVLADYILANTGGATVSNLSSTQALRDITEKHGYTYHAAAVGEVNVVTKMKEVRAVFGGEGNGGVIYPELHYGRDALVGVALILSYLARENVTMSGLKKRLPDYTITKHKVSLPDDMDPDIIIALLLKKYEDSEKNTEDGLKIHFENEWVHMRKSNTEPIIRIYAESRDQASADKIATKFKKEIEELCRV